MNLTQKKENPEENVEIEIHLQMCIFRYIKNL